MGVFDGIKDSPQRDIRAEGQTIAIKIEKTSPSTARISWSIPIPFAGCRIDELVYNGIVVTLDTSPTSIQKSPVNGTVYTADPTADSNLHAGDKITTSLVVFAAYDDKTTTFVDISGLSPNVAYYASGYAVDNVLRYHTEGVHSYSLPYGNAKEDSIGGYQDVQINGAIGTDPTGLIAATTYTFKLNADGTEYTIAIDGTLSPTYDDLVNQLNKQINLIGNPPQSNGYPNAGSFYYKTSSKELFQWDGQTHNLIPVINWDTDPRVPATGSYWYDTTNSLLFKQNSGWQPTTVIEFSKDPTLPSCDDFWFTGTSVNRWTGTVWTPYNLLSQTVDPSIPPVMSCPFYWYNEDALVLNSWNDDTLVLFQKL